MKENLKHSNWTEWAFVQELPFQAIQHITNAMLDTCQAGAYPVYQGPVHWTSYIIVTYGNPWHVRQETAKGFHSSIDYVKSVDQLIELQCCSVPCHNSLCSHATINIDVYMWNQGVCTVLKYAPWYVHICIYIYAWFHIKTTFCR